MEKESFNLLYYLRFFNRWKGWILLPATLAAFVTLVIGLCSPRPYTTEATILLSGMGTFSIGTHLGNFGIPDLSLGNPNVDIVSSMIQSRRMAEDITDHFKLMEKWGVRNRPLLIQKVKRMVTSSEMKNGLRIEVTTEDPQLSSDIANFCVTNLDAMNDALHLTTEKPVAKILDPAIPPTVPSSRKILPRVCLTFFVWVTGCTVFIFLREYIKDLLRKENEEQMFSVGVPDKDKEQIFS